MLAKQPIPKMLKVRIHSSLSDLNEIVYLTTEQYFEVVRNKEVNHIKRIEILQNAV